jgi:peptide chain release factor 1
VVECQVERSQYKNKDRAMKILRRVLRDETSDRSKTRSERKSQIGSETVGTNSNL